MFYLVTWLLLGKKNSKQKHRVWSCHEIFEDDSIVQLNQSNNPTYVQSTD